VPSAKPGRPPCNDCQVGSLIGGVMPSPGKGTRDQSPAAHRWCIIRPRHFGKGYDATCAEMASNFRDDPVDSEKARLRLAEALLTIANEEGRHIEVLKGAALQRMALDATSAAGDQRRRAYARRRVKAPLGTSRGPRAHIFRPQRRSSQKTSGRPVITSSARACKACGWSLRYLTAKTSYLM
jgi:hypothetical protein